MGAEDRDEQGARGMENAFIYSFVARGTVVLAEYTEFTGNFPAIAAQCLQKLPSSNSRYTYACDHHAFNFLVEDGYVGKQISMIFLERLKGDFKKRFGGGRADTALTRSLSKEFGPVIKEHMDYVIDQGEELVNVLKVKAQVSEIKSFMMENVEKVMDRGQKLDDLAEKSTGLRAEAQHFKTKGNQIRRKMWAVNMKVKGFVLAFLLLLVLIVWVSVCQGFDCTN